MSEIKLTHCSFCGNHKDVVKKLIVGDDVAICSECIDLCNSLLTEDKASEFSTTETPQQFDAYAIKEHLDKHVIGQDDAKTVLSVAIANHYKRITKPPSDGLEIQKGNVLLVGPTGSGKTLLAKTVAKFINVPFVVADATSLTEAGYVGDDVESMISMLLAAANHDVKLAERGIVFIDEVDKIARKSEHTSITRDVSGEGVQQALLKIVEGTKCRVHPNGNKKHPGAEMIEVDTKNILFIAGGAFVGLETIIKNRLKGGTIGFGSTYASHSTENALPKVSPDDLTRFGMIPEFIGRFTTTITLEELNKEQLIHVLTSIKNNFIEQYQYLFSLDNIKLTFTDKSLEQIAENCIALKTGARGLQSELERILLPHMFHAIQYFESGVKEINITQELVDEPKTLLEG